MLSLFLAFVLCGRVPFLPVIRQEHPSQPCQFNGGKSLIEASFSKMFLVCTRLTAHLKLAYAKPPSLRIWNSLFPFFPAFLTHHFLSSKPGDPLNTALLHSSTQVHTDHKWQWLKFRRVEDRGLGRFGGRLGGAEPWQCDFRTNAVNLCSTVHCLQRSFLLDHTQCWMLF